MNAQEIQWWKLPEFELARYVHDPDPKIIFACAEEVARRRSVAQSPGHRARMLIQQHEREERSEE